LLRYGTVALIRYGTVLFEMNVASEI
jgi:hypothetical protein